MDPTPDRIFQIGSGFWSSKTLLAAVELEVFTILGQAPADVESLKQRLGFQDRGARDFFDTLVALGFLESRDGVYRNTPEAALFLDKAKPSYIGGMLEMASRRLYGFWDHLIPALRSGEPQNEVKGGEEPFATIYADPERLRGFLRAMTGVSRGANLAIAQNFPWSSYQTCADVGTAQGDLVAQIVRANPHLRGTGYDLPVVGTVFEEYIAGLGLTERVKFQAGDFFQDEFPQTDVILMGHILHDWDLPTKRMLLEKAWRALPPGGAVIVYDAIIDDDRSQNAFGLLMSLNMLIETPGGFDYTGADCIGWMKEAGFRDCRVEHLVGPDSMVIGIK
ncbi:acetylserotonin O-methyltransferase [Luteolibacter arcticus]|uniref:Acetylserotonin O-methyltransferase n=1 Tax=Luteolibacter arcticus TaxID=1581411 RepID=A0ABT3GBY2_9BACT|nr:acetylserotonin O-methyltransferase [Luteolibacter arcticus]MCW1921136.1 acetylserotonin O-methyltransferase [Luteolibacter arcticus]